MNRSSLAEAIADVTASIRSEGESGPPGGTAMGGDTGSEWREQLGPWHGGESGACCPSTEAVSGTVFTVCEGVPGGAM